MKKIYVLFSVMAMLASCASNKDKDADLPVEDLYNKAYEDLQATRYKKAAEGFERVEVEHPYSQWAVKSKLMGAYAYYKDEKYDDAIMAADRFIRYHPGNKDVAYAYYLKGMSYYDQISSADKDQGNTEKAEETFSRLVALFPDSEYAEDARNKLNLTKDYKAGQEMIVGRYYLQQGNYLSALNRFNVVLENYQTTVQIEEALYRQVEIYGILGMNKYAQGYYKILKQNYPDGKWTEKAAKIMEKIGVNDPLPAVKKEAKPAKVSSENAKTEGKRSWFGWFKHNDEAEKVTVPAKEKADNSLPEDNESWFNWFRKNQKKENDVTLASEHVDKAVEEEKKGWFSWFKNNSDEKKATAETSVKNTEKESTTLFSRLGWGSDETASVSKDEVGDILSGDPEGNK